MLMTLAISISKVEGYWSKNLGNTKEARSHQEEGLEENNCNRQSH